MPRVLIAILSWAKGAVNGDNDAQRQTFLKEVDRYPGLEYRFFIGDGTPVANENEAAVLKSFTTYDLDYYNKKAAESKKASPIIFTPKPDEVVLHVPDDYYHLCYKTREASRWAFEHGFEYLFKIDTDTLVHISRLMGSGFEQHDYIGRSVTQRDIQYAAGGPGYWLRRKAFQLLIDKESPDWAEDRWVGSIMKQHSIPLQDDRRYANFPHLPNRGNTVITSHLTSPPKKYDATEMYAFYEYMGPQRWIPHVTAICPTGNRQHLIGMAIDSFLAQSYQDSELLIYDDGEEATPVPDHKRIRYIKVPPEKQSTGKKRNKCCELARGEIIVHFDDDDWSAPNRIANQVERLKTSGKSVTGYHSIVFYDTATGEAFEKSGSGAATMGATQAYLKSYWQKHRFADRTAGEDAHFANGAEAMNQMDSLDGRAMVVARRHAVNTWLTIHNMKSIPMSSLPEGFLNAQNVGSDRARGDGGGARDAGGQAEIIKRYNGLRILIAILGCHRKRTLPDAQRETWLADVANYPVDYRYFLGRVPADQIWDPRRPEERRPVQAAASRFDEVILDVPDDYKSLPLKTYAMIAWAFWRGYDYVAKGDDDSYARVDRLLQSGFEQHHYYGFKKLSPYFGKPAIPYAQGGAVYWLDRQAMAIILAAKPLESGPEDIYVGKLLAAANVQLVHDRRYCPNMEWLPRPDNDNISCHKCTPQEMRDLHNKFAVKPPTASPSIGLGQEPIAESVGRVALPQAAEAGRV